MSICQKPYCNNQSIPRGKYCEYHKTTTRRHRLAPPLPSQLQPSLQEIIPSHNHHHRSDDNDRKTQLLIDRILKEEQEAEYLDAIEKDKLKFTEKHNKEIKLQLREEQFKTRQERLDIIEPALDEINILKLKFHLPNNLKVIRSFRQTDLIDDIFEFLEVFMYNNKIEGDFQVIMYPKIIVTNEQRNNLISTLNSTGNKMCFVSLV